MSKRKESCKQPSAFTLRSFWVLLLLPWKLTQRCSAPALFTRTLGKKVCVKLFQLQSLYTDCFVSSHGQKNSHES